MKTVTLLGSTGSVGVNTLRVIEAQGDSFKVSGLAAGSNVEILKKQIDQFLPESVYLKDASGVAELSKIYGRRLKLFSGEEGLSAFCASVDSDILVAATNGTNALLAVLDALEKGKRVALANKEILVVAGGLVMRKLKENPNASLIPVDSEHSAIFQCLEGGAKENIRKIILTGSGGPLREISGGEFKKVSKELVVNHPKWKMGRKISVDSATLMNKGLEIIEAAWLFDVAVEAIEVLIHPEAVIHSMVEFKDGAVLAQLGVADMRLPIQYALSCPRRLEAPGSMRLDWATIGPLSFSPPDKKKFPCFSLALEAAKRSGSAPCVLSAADEVAVGAYLDDTIDFLGIPSVIEKVLSRHRHVASPGLSEIRAIYAWALEEAKRMCQNYQMEKQLC